MARNDYIDILKSCSNTLRENYGILSLRVFGSVARNEQRDDSDVDLFVETKTPNPFMLMDAREFLEHSMGRHVDIVRNHRNLNPRLRKRIEKDGIIVF
ncbi:MAG: nucleotidyltransferase domain-containing protein [Prevotella sp.]|nr:nucleotidyltransferase domain-containing protein [Prevotella sp.]